MPGTSLKLRVSTMPILSYSPQFVAEALRFYEDEGLEVTFVLGTPDLGLIGAVTEGRADVVLGNILFALRFPGPDGLVPFAQSNQHTRYVLSARRGEASDAFEWGDLRGKVVFIPSQLPTPWVAFREVLRVAGVSLDEVRPIVGYTAKEMVSEFGDGVADFLMSDVETAQDDRLEEVAALSETLGRVPWSVYCVPRTQLGPRREELLAFRRAIERAQRWIAAHGAREVAETLEVRFSEVDLAYRARMVERYQRMGLWSDSATIEVEEADRWQHMMARWGILPEPLPMEELMKDVREALGD